MDDYDRLARNIDPLQNEIMVIEGVDNEPEEMEIEGVDT